MAGFHERTHRLPGFNIFQCFEVLSGLRRLPGLRNPWKLIIDLLNYWCTYFTMHNVTHHAKFLRIYLLVNWIQFYYNLTPHRPLHPGIQASSQPRPCEHARSFESQTQISNFVSKQVSNFWLRTKIMDSRANSGSISNSDNTFFPYIDTFQDPIEVSRNRNWSYSNSIQ